MKDELHRILAEFRDLKRETYTLEEFHTRTGALADDIRTVLRTQLAPKGDDEPEIIEVDEDWEAQTGRVER